MSNTNSKAVKIILIAWLAYLISYIGRSDYSACLLEIVIETGASRATAGMVSSAFAICNAVGQFISAFVIKKVSPVKIISIELFTVAIINLLFPVTNSFIIMALLWGINGCMQSTLLCGVTLIFTQTLKEPYLSRGAVLLNTIGAVGGMFNYLLSWFIVRYFNWKLVFITVSTLLFILGVFWCIIMPRLTENKCTVQPTEKADSKNKLTISQILTSNAAVFVILGGMFVGLLRESISLWIPTYMNDRLNLSSDSSVIITAFVPCLQICGALLGGYIGSRSKNLLILSFSAFTLSSLCLLLINFGGKTSVIITLILFIINAISMTAALTFLLSLYPIRHFSKENAVVMVGIINFFVHLGDFISTFGIGWLSQAGGWSITLITLSVLAFLAAILCLLGSYTQKRRAH